jgi:hypothetical protein
MRPACLKKWAYAKRTKYRQSLSGGGRGKDNGIVSVRKLTVAKTTLIASAAGSGHTIIL